MARQNERKLLRGSFDEKLTQVESIIRKMNRRQNNYVIGVTPPIPVFDWVKEPDENGVVFRKLMPGNGKITIGCMYVEELNQQLNPQAVLNIEGKLGGMNIKIPITKQALSIEPLMPVEFGQRLMLSVDPVEACKGIWTAFLFEVDIAHTQKDQQLADGFLALVEEADGDIEDAGV